MERTATAIVLALMMSLTAALSAVPVQAVSPDCTEDFEIADSESDAQTRQLLPEKTETGAEEVAPDEGNQKVTVELKSDNDVLEFGIFEEGTTCERSDNVSESACLSDVELNTTGTTVSEDSHVCTLEADDLLTREFDFVMENLQESDALDYRIYVSG